MKISKALLVAALILAPAAALAGPYPGQLRPHGHSGPSDGGLLTAISIQGNATVTSTSTLQTTFTVNQSSGVGGGSTQSPDAGIIVISSGTAGLGGTPYIKLSCAVNPSTVAYIAIIGDQVAAPLMIRSRSPHSFSPSTRGFSMSMDGNDVVSIRGTQTNDDATAGDYGEYFSSKTASPTNFTATATWGDLATITLLTGGDYDITMVADAQLNGATMTQWVAGMSTTSGNNGAGMTVGDNQVQQNAPVSATDASVSISNWRLKVTAATNVYLKYKGAYSAGTPQCSGRISARRVR